MIVSPQEQYIINLLRELKPFEQISIVKDKEGKPDTFLIQRSQKIMVSQIKIQEVK